MAISASSLLAARLSWAARPPFRPASAAVSLDQWWAVPALCALLPPAPVQQAVAKVLNPLHQTAELLVAAEDVALGLRDCMELRADLRREMVVHGALIGEAGRKGPTMPSFVQKPLWHLARLRRGLT